MNIVPFNPNSALPALPADLVRMGEEMNADLGGGLQGRIVNRISVRQGRWVMMRGGEVVSRIQEEHIDVVIVGSSDKVSRLFYLKGYDVDAPKERPTCWSRDGVTPDSDVPVEQRQGNACATCAKNAKGSAADGKSRACAFKKPIVVVPAGGEEVKGIGAVEPVLWLLSVNAQSMYDDSKPDKNLYSLKGFIELMQRPRSGAPKGVPVGYTVTRMSMDVESSTPKYWFTPIGYLPAEGCRKSAELFNSEEVRDLLNQSADEAAVQQHDRVVGQPEVDRTAPQAAPKAAPPVAKAAPVTQAAVALPGWGQYAMANGVDPEDLEMVRDAGGPTTAVGAKLWGKLINLDLSACNPNVFNSTPTSTTSAAAPEPEAIQSKMSWWEHGLANDADDETLEMIQGLGGPGTAKGRKIWDAMVGAELTADIDLSVEAAEEQTEDPTPKTTGRRGRPKGSKNKSTAADAPTAAPPVAAQAPAPVVAQAPAPAVPPTAPAQGRAASLAAAVAGFDD